MYFLVSVATTKERPDRSNSEKKVFLKGWAGRWLRGLEE